MIEVSKAVFEKEGKYLLLKRASRSRSYPDLWDFPGGKHDPGETPQESVLRETKEETGYEIEPGEEVLTKEYHDEKHDIIFHYFTPKIIAGELKLSDDHSEFRWVAKEELNDLELHPAVRLFFTTN